MGLFEFLMILLSVIIGLALTELLTGVASLLRVRETVHFYWVHVGLQFGIFIALLQQWWESWDLARVEVISFGAVLLLIVPSLVLFLIAHMLFPRPATDTNLEDYYYKQSPVIWWLIVFGTVEGTFIIPLVEHEPIFHAANISGLPTVVLCVALAVSKNRKVHAFLAPTVLALVILDTWLVNPIISSV
ncbi:MAG: hypothetical protein OEW68_14185 [Gammaproteobacteria bacterium]|nr:hypothetical protein [Gammaproteobacteria bacterium]MDH4315980.1 hypothetical protein [Gammaproteobacteria bacterium]MDH5215215.1 hypothetical protein [Gammaproteobacteria bacterium]